LRLIIALRRGNEARQQEQNRYGYPFHENTKIAKWQLQGLLELIRAD
jgi:hypothetical protein